MKGSSMGLTLVALATLSTRFVGAGAMIAAAAHHDGDAAQIEAVFRRWEIQRALRAENATVVRAA